MSNEFLVKRSFKIGHVRTSVALERPFWDALENMVQNAWGRTMTELITDVDMRRDPNQPLASALRCFCLLSGN